jgi:hypothetical protein
MRTQLISDATTWPTISADPHRWDETLTWLRANHIDPCDVPTDATITIEDGAVIRYEVFCRDTTGHKYLADPDDTEKGAAREERTVPLLASPPVHWPAETVEEG